MRIARLCQGFRPNLGIFDVTLVPGIPDRDIGPIVCPGHGKKVEAAIFENLHAVVFDSDLRVGATCPVSQVAFCIAISHDHYVQGLGGPEVADGHSV